MQHLFSKGIFLRSAVLLSIGIGAILPSFASAAAFTVLEGKERSIDVAKIIEAFFNIFWPIVVAIIVGAFIYAGVKFLTAQGDPAKIATARMAVIWGLVGVVIILLSVAIIGFVTRFFAPEQTGTLACGNLTYPQCYGYCPSGQTCTNPPNPTGSSPCICQ
jgi:hypothetical protein